MAKSSTRATQFCIGASAVALATGMAGAAMAAAADEGRAVSEVVVTGTRLGHTDAASANPITVITPETLKMTNIVTVDDVLSTVPGIQVDTNAGNGTQTGTAGIEMRNLGFNRTLVLMNSRRYTPSITIAGVSVNVLAIPESMIDHVEVLKDGASPIYGSDAIAGVVNIITKQNFVGLQLDAEGGISAHGDRGSRHFSATAGRNFADGDGNVLLNLDYTKRDAITRGDRTFTQNPVQGYKLNADGTYTPVFGTSISPGGVTSGVRQIAGGAAVTFNSPTSFTPLGSNLFVESSDDSTLLPELETYSANAQALGIDGSLCRSQLRPHRGHDLWQRGAGLPRPELHLPERRDRAREQSLQHLRRADSAVPRIRRDGTAVHGHHRGDHATGGGPAGDAPA
jgi:outer membrane receptor protein involved in Fe transport